MINESSGIRRVAAAILDCADGWGVDRDVLVESLPDFNKKYRARCIVTLEEFGLVWREDKVLWIRDLKGLERFVATGEVAA